MPGRVFVTGASGFVGSAVAEELVGRGYSVNALSNRRDVPPHGGRVAAVKGGLFDEKALDDGLRGADATIHLVGIIMEKSSKGITFGRIHVEGTRRAVEAAKRGGVKRFVHMSALGTRPDAISQYHQTKYEAEQIVRASGLDWTIFRPSMIHGPGGEFMKMEAAWARRKSPPFVAMPYFGAGLAGLGGAGLLQPVFVGDVARAFVDALEKPAAVHQIYPLGGPAAMTWPEMHRAASRAIVGKARRVLPVPAWYAKALASIPLLKSVLPFNKAQVLMSQEDNTCDTSKFSADFGWEPREFGEALGTYASRL